MIKLIGLISPVVVPLIVSGILFFSSEKKNIPKLYLAAYMIVIAFVFVANAFYFQHDYKVYSWMHSLHIGTVLAIYPGAYVYILLLIDPSLRFRSLIIHFLPSISFFLASALIFFPILSTEERSLFLTEYRFSPDFSMLWLKILYIVRMGNIVVLFIQVILYMVLTLISLKKHREKVANIFSNPEKFQLNWLRIFNLSIALSAFVTV